MSGVRTHIREQMLSVVMLDLLCLVGGSLAGIVLRVGHQEISDYMFLHAEGWLLLFGSVLLANYLAGSYQIQHTFSRFNLVVTWAFSIVFALLILSITSYAWFLLVLGRGVLFLSLAFYSVLSLSFKLLVYRTLLRKPRFECRTVILGIGSLARDMRRLVESEHVLPAHRVVAWLRPAEGRRRTESADDAGGGRSDEERAGSRQKILDGVAVIEAGRDELDDVVHSLGADLVIVGIEDREQAADLFPQLKRIRFEGIEVLTPLSVAEIYSGRLPLGQLSEDYLMRASMESGLPSIRRFKRVLDILVSLVAFLLLWAPALLIAVLIKLGAPRSRVLYTQTRVGQFGVRFRIYKFRTMREDAEAGTGPVWSGEDDPRVTRMGRALRKFRLDEIPQFFNVIKGDMSLVGPRPERPEIAARIEEKIPFFAERQNVMPGLTGWAQIRRPYGDSVEDAARKLEFDLYYIKNLSLSLDVQIILSTLRIILFGKEREM